MKKITAPEAFFGFRPGEDRKIARWDRIVEYFRLLARESDRIAVEDMGPSTLGNPFLKVTITSPRNHENLEDIRKAGMALADPRGLTQPEIDALVSKGKAVCVQSMSLHADEIGGTQMSVLLAYDLCAGGGGEVLNILDNVVFVMVPCFNPDGQIMLTDWYYKYLGTEYEGCGYPSLYHAYAGHSNNRDAFAQNLAESRHMAKILFREWMPQAFQDHHHMGSYGARIQIAPYKNPVRPYVDPLTWRELNLYGAAMAYRLDSRGLDGVSGGAQFPGWGHYGFHWMVNSHNIAGMLTESASARLATPKFIHPTQLTGDGDYVMPDYEAQNNFPNPWPGGWWRLSDIVERMYWSAYGLLDAMAKDRALVLENMARKALRQTAKGAQSDIYAFIIPPVQHDPGAARRLIEILLNQGIEVHEAQSAFAAARGAYGGGVKAAYDKGSHVVFLAQPKMGVAMTLLGRTKYPDNQWTRDKKGAITGYDTVTNTVAEFMGVSVIPANAAITGEFIRISRPPDNAVTDIPYTDLYGNPLPAGDTGDAGGARKTPAAAGRGRRRGYVLSARENDSFRAVNLLLKSGEDVFRVDACPYRDFYVECAAKKINGVFKEAPCGVREVNERPGGLTPFRAAKVAMYQRYYGGNADEGWARLTMEQFSFGYATVFDRDMTSERLGAFDVLIIPSDDAWVLIGPKNAKPGDVPEYAMQYYEERPEEYRSGFGKEGAEAIKKFVESGGRLLAFDQACNFAIETCGLRVSNVVKGVPAEKYNTHGSTLRVGADVDDPAAYGMPKKALILQWNAPVFEVTDQLHAENYSVVLRYADGDVLESGALDGEKYVNGKGAMIKAKCGAGEVALYGFSPHWRAQTHGTFKLLFNMLYI